MGRRDHGDGDSGGNRRDLRCTEDGPGDQNPCGAQRTGRRPVVCRKTAIKGAKCKISPTINPSICIKYLNEHLHEVPDEGKNIVFATNEAYRKLGSATYL